MSVRLAVMRQDWRDLTFLHFEVDPDALAATLPRGFSPDRYQGRAYVGLVPFRMRRVRLNGLPPVPGTTDFLETNVRTYVVGPDGCTGVWFYSLDAANRLACAIARATFGLPYFFAQMSYRAEGDRREYRCARGELTSHLVIQDAGESLREAAPDSLDHFLLERYRLFSVRRGGVMTGEVAHAPYRFRPITLAHRSDASVAAAGFPEVGPVVHAVYSPGVDVRIGRPTRVRV
ncbi:MAG: DUF2071 domain-containing protein [Fimbriimonadaceae bacterium]|nr:DUF2071 domain-containing protein [Fimbriimonadaceae bacterium]